MRGLAPRSCDACRPSSRQANQLQTTHKLHSQTAVQLPDGRGGAVTRCMCPWLVNTVRARTRRPHLRFLLTPACTACGGARRPLHRPSSCAAAALVFSPTICWHSLIYCACMCLLACGRRSAQAPAERGAQAAQSGGQRAGSCNACQHSTRPDMLLWFACSSHVRTATGPGLSPGKARSTVQVACETGMKRVQVLRSM